MTEQTSKQLNEQWTTEEAYRQEAVAQLRVQTAMAQLRAAQAVYEKLSIDDAETFESTAEQLRSIINALAEFFGYKQDEQAQAGDETEVLDMAIASGVFISVK